MKIRPSRDARTRLLWGVLLFSGRIDGPLLLGEGWCHKRTQTVGDECAPLRTLLFCSRREARAWCRRKNAEWRAHGWTVRPVRVRERIEVVG